MHTQDIAAPDLTKLNRQHLASVYEVAADQWRHAEQARWALLNNYLVACTILILAWATVYGPLSGQVNGLARWVLGVLAAAGAILSTWWVLLMLRASEFVKVHQDVLMAAEGALPGGDELGMHRAERARAKLSPVAQSRWVLPGVASLFLLVFAALGVTAVVL
jgi:hypothetical protein